MYETPDQKDPVFDAKGIETVRRDSCSAVSKVCASSNCFAKADHSLAKLRTANSLPVRLFIHQCLVRHLTFHLSNHRSVSGMYELNEKCVLFKVKRYSCAFPLRNKLSAEDLSLKIEISVASQECSRTVDSYRELEHIRVRS